MTSWLIALGLVVAAVALLVATHPRGRTLRPVRSRPPQLADDLPHVDVYADGLIRVRLPHQQPVELTSAEQLRELFEATRRLVPGTFPVQLTADPAVDARPVITALERAGCTDLRLDGLHLASQHAEVRRARG